MKNFFGLTSLLFLSLNLSARELDPKLQRECLTEGTEILEESYGKFITEKLDLNSSDYKNAYADAAAKNEKLIRSYCGKIKNKLNRKTMALMDQYVNESGEIDYYMKYVNRVKRYCNEPNRLLNEINHFMFDELNNNSDVNATFFGGDGRLKRQMVATCNDLDEYVSSFFTTSTPNFNKLKAEIVESKKQLELINTTEYQNRVTEEINARFNYAFKIINDNKLYKEAKEILNDIILDDPNAEECLKAKVETKLENAKNLYQDMNRVAAMMSAALLKQEYAKVKDGINSPKNIELMNAFFEKQAGYLPENENPLGYKGVINYDHNEMLKYYSPIFIAATIYPPKNSRGENMLATLINAGLNINTPSGPGNLTPLMGIALNESNLDTSYAKATHGYAGKSSPSSEQTFQQLLTAGADDRVTNKNGKNILHLLAESQAKEKSLELFQILKNHPGNHLSEIMLKKDSIWGLSPLELYASSTDESDIKVKQELYAILAKEIRENRLKLDDLDVKSEHIKDSIKALISN